ncbi:MAG: RluA family pseudouridine synthase [Eubacterium sp.]|nr:RluA family pseudouridine synthase [Eubacterium sp.]
MRELIVGKNEAGQKLKKYCFIYFREIPQSFTYKMLRKKNILLNEKKASGEEVLKEGDKIQMYFAEETLNDLRRESEPKKALPKLADYPWFTKESVLYENEDMLILNKPVGVLSQKSSPKDKSANDAVIAYLLEQGELKGETLDTFRPSICNRLDRNTSGVMSASKTRKGARELANLYSEKDGRTTQKFYLTIVHGKCPLKGHYDRLDYVKSRNGNQAYVWLHGGKRPAETLKYGDPTKIWTELYPLDYNADKNVTLMLCRLHTGKSHQIRVTMQHYKYPVVGDPKYGDPKKNEKLDPSLTGQLLHAFQIKLPNDVIVQAAVPKTFSKYFPKAEEKALKQILSITQGV